VCVAVCRSIDDLTECYYDVSEEHCGGDFALAFIDFQESQVTIGVKCTTCRPSYSFRYVQAAIKLYWIVFLLPAFLSACSFSFNLFHLIRLIQATRPIQKQLHNIEHTIKKHGARR